MGYNFDGVNKIIEMTSSTAITVLDLYSRWKEWVQMGDNSKYAPAFRSVAGDPIGGGQNIAPYIFLATTDGWRIRPHESDHELRIAGNLYSDDASLTMFAPTLGDYTVSIIIERSSAAISMTVGGVDQATVQAALTAQGYTISRAPKLDFLDETVSTVGGLTPSQATMLLELYRIMGLDPTKPLVVDRAARSAGAEISQTIVRSDQTVIVTRN